MGQIGTIEKLHDHVRRARLERADVGHLRHVLALQANRRLRFAEESLDCFLALERAGQEELERDLLLELNVRRRDDDTHATDAEDRVHAVLPGEDVTYGDGKVCIGGRRQYGAPRTRIARPASTRKRIR